MGNIRSGSVSDDLAHQKVDKSRNSTRLVIIDFEYASYNYRCGV